MIKLLCWNFKTWGQVFHYCCSISPCPDCATLNMMRCQTCPDIKRYQMSLLSVKSAEHLTVNRRKCLFQCVPLWFTEMYAENLYFLAGEPVEVTPKMRAGNTLFVTTSIALCSIAIKVYIEINKSSEMTFGQPLQRGLWEESHFSLSSVRSGSNIRTQTDYQRSPTADYTCPNSCHSHDSFHSYHQTARPACLDIST